MGESSPPSPTLHLDLDNFDTTDAEDSTYVLTSPRSLESCARLGVKPVQLLIKSLSDFVDDNVNPDIPFKALTVLYEAYEREGRGILQLCREEREKIVLETKERRPSLKLSALETVVEVESRNSLEDPKSREDSCDGLRTQTNQSVDHSPRRKSVSNGRSSYSAAITREQNRNSLRPTDKNMMVCSLSLGDLRHSPATERQLERLTRDVRKKMNVTVPEKDRKIAALMLVKHQEKQTRLMLSQQEEQEREEARRQEEVRRVQAERRRKKELEKSMQRWQDGLEARRRQKERQEKELAGQREQEVLLQEDRWRRLTEEQEVRKRDKKEMARREAEERKCLQEQLLKDMERLEQAGREKEVQLSQEKEQRARRSRVIRERRERKRLQQENQREHLRCLLLKREVQQQMEEEEALMRSAVEEKLQRSWEKRAQAVALRLRELQERSAREEEQIQRAQLRASWHSQQQLREKEVLAQLSQRRMEQASQNAHTQRRSRAQRAQQENMERLLCHQRLLDSVQREEETERQLRECCLSLKERRRERLQRQREEVQEEARRVARASFHMREKVREATDGRTFHQMALQAQLAASLLDRGKI
ncbi:coiled-coil domain-containing protein 177-like [Oncorhynchus clarkii lewisi]|uniref:coiled-coil domain-containing protein 177-like n=1 Tax=Oncorhynchus clarkii lewisi TaxID=490388 RepID=UPI0039B8922F